MKPTTHAYYHGVCVGRGVSVQIRHTDKRMDRQSDRKTDTRVLFFNTIFSIER